MDTETFCEELQLVLVNLIQLTNYGILVPNKFETQGEQPLLQSPYS